MHWRERRDREEEPTDALGAARRGATAGDGAVAEGEGGVFLPFGKKLWEIVGIVKNLRYICSGDSMLFRRRGGEPVFGCANTPGDAVQSYRRKQETISHVHASIDSSKKPFRTYTPL